MARMPISEILSAGAGWGALEKMRRDACEESSIPDGMSFPASSVGFEQAPWVALLETGIMPKQDALDTPPSWMTDPKWAALLESSLLLGGDSATARLHLGVMKYEGFCFGNGIGEWKKSLEFERTPWALRNLAVSEKRAGRLDEAIRYMEEALVLENNCVDRAFTEEYFDLLIAAGMFEKLWVAYQNLPEDRKTSDRILMQAGYVAVELNELDFVEIISEKEFANIREGDNLLVDMWFKYAAKREAEKRSISFSDELYRETRTTKLSPANIDFRMVDK
jgi:tetratricopeptide (TPR) repeat protein